jgi:hypothetical protein
MSMTTANGVEPHPSRAEDHNRVAGANVGRVQDGAGARYNSAAEQRSLSERKLLRYDGKLVLMDERAFGETTQPEPLEQASPIAAQARGIGCSAQCRLRMSALEGAAR